MPARDELADRFEAHRRELTSVAYRLLGSLSEAEDAVQESWLRLARVDAAELHDLAAWFGRNARFAAIALVDGAIGLVVAPRGRLSLAIRFTVAGDRVAAYELIGDPARLGRLDLALAAGAV